MKNFLSKTLKHHNFSVYFISALTFVLHILVSNRLGFYADELYLIDCSKHLDFGYVDITPIVPFLICLTHTLFGDSLTALRLFPALGHSATVLITGLIAGELGGKSFSRTLASLCVLIAPAFLRIGSVFVIPSLEPAIWTLAAYLVLLIIKYDRPKLWILVGLVSGLGVMTKPTMLLFVCGLTLALAITPLRVQFLNRWIWLGGLTAMSVLLPNLIWQINHDWITIEFIQSVKSSSWVNSINLSDFLFGQVFYLHPICAFIWMSGIYYFFFRHEAKTYRIFGWIYIIVLVLLISQGSKLYYLLPIYPLLFAAGSVNFEKWVALTRYRRLPACVLTIFAGAGIVMAPGGLPILSIKQFDQFAKIITLGLIDAKKAPELFEMFRDMSGQAREAFLQDVARVYGSLSTSERARTTILASNYAQAGAINILGARFGIPQSVSGNVSYYLWGPREQTGETTIAVGFHDRFLRSAFHEVLDLPSTPYIKLCRYPVAPLSQMWRHFKSFPNY